MPLSRVPALASGMRMFAALLAALMLPAALGAQATVTVPVQDPAYRDLDRLFGSGLIKTMIVGQKPYSRREIARIVIDASKTPPSRPGSDGNRRVLERRAGEFAPESSALRGGAAWLQPVSGDLARAGTRDRSGAAAVRVRTGDGGRPPRTVESAPPRHDSHRDRHAVLPL